MYKHRVMLKLKEKWKSLILLENTDIGIRQDDYMLQLSRLENFLVNLTVCEIMYGLAEIKCSKEILCISQSIRILRQWTPNN